MRGITANMRAKRVLTLEMKGVMEEGFDEDGSVEVVEKNAGHEVHASSCRLEKSQDLMPLAVKMRGNEDEKEKKE